MPRLSFHCTEKKQHSSFHSFEISSFCVCMQSTSRGQRDARAHTHLSVALASPVAIGGAFAPTLHTLLRTNIVKYSMCPSPGTEVPC